MFFFFLPLFNTSTVSLYELNNLVSQVSLTNRANQEHNNSSKTCNSPLSLEEIIEQGDALRASTLGEDIKTVVKEIDTKLSEFFGLGISPIDAISIINSFFIDVGELVLAAVEEKAHTLLKFLQLIYIWRDDAQFHWFQALSYKSPWYDEQMWKTHPMDWRRNIQIVCEWDNGALAAVIKTNMPPEYIVILDEELLLLCIEHDAISVFKTIGIDPIRLKEHLEILTRNSSARLLKFYQSHTEISHLHLERFPFPEKLPASAGDFKFLMSHGYDCFPISQLTRRCCKEGRLDLLKYLYKLNSKLLPTHRDLNHAAEKGWLNILKWAFHLKVTRWNTTSIFITLAINRHFQALDWLTTFMKRIVDERIIREVVSSGCLEALQWIDNKQPIIHGQQEWADLAARECHIPVLKWLYEKFQILPSIEFLGYVTAEVLDWMQTIDSILIQPELIDFMAGNFELLQWIYKNASASIFATKEKVLSENIQSMEMMLWIHKNLNICPSFMNWAYEMGDLEAIQWAAENCNITPNSLTSYIAAESGHLHIIKWIHKTYSEQILIFDMLEGAITAGSLEVADYLMLNFDLKEKLDLQISYYEDADQHLETLKWVYKHNFNMTALENEMTWAVERGDLQTIEWLTKTFPNILLDSNIWYHLVDNNYHEIYKWFLDNYPDERAWHELSEDIFLAFISGHLEIVKIIIGKDSSFVERISKIEVVSTNYHIKQWLIVNGKLKRS